MKTEAARRVTVSGKIFPLEKEKLKKPSKPAISKLIRKTAQVTMRLPFEEGQGLGNRMQEEVPDVPTNMPAEEASQAARQYLTEGKLDSCKAFLSVIQEGGIAPDYLCKQWTDLGNAYYDRGLMTETCQAFTMAHRFCQETVATNFNLGLALHMVGRLPEAKERYEHALGFDPEQSKIWCNLGVLNFQMGKLDAAAEATRKAIDFRADYLRAWDNLAGVLGGLGHLNESLDACFSALAIDESYSNAWLKVGLIYFEQSQWELAQNAFEKAEGMGELEAMRHYSLARCLMKAGHLSEAKKLCNQAYREQKACDVAEASWSELHEAFDKKGDLMEANRARAMVELLQKNSTAK